MAKPQKDDSDKLPKDEAKARFERTVQRMLNTPPKPHAPPKPKRRARRSKIGNVGGTNNPGS
jgi:hypothetical protein